MIWFDILKDEDESDESYRMTADEEELKKIDEATKSLLAIIKDSNNLSSIWPRTQHTITMLEQLREALGEKRHEYYIDRKFPHWKQTEEVRE
jgi:pyruvate formate-lyase activating enzyme-like uncharacterized protein